MEMILFVDTVGMSCWRILILQQSEAILSISAAFVRTTMTYHSPPAMVAIGLLGDEANRTQLRTVRWIPMATAQESRSDAGTTDLAEAGDTRAHSHLWGMLTAHGPSVLFDDGEFR